VYYARICCLVLEKKTASYRELYPYAIGYKEDLDREVPLCKLQAVLTDGISGSHASIHKYPAREIPVINCTSKTIDATKGGFLFMNVSKAPSNDALIVHPPEDVEGIQFKSSEYISLGKQPTALLDLGKKNDQAKKGKSTIWKEFKKVTNSKHMKFYSKLVTKTGSKRHFTFVVISNKPLDNYDKICEAVTKNDKINGLPSGTIVICNQNFQSYAACFAHRGLFIPSLSEKQDELNQKIKSNQDQQLKENEFIEDD